MKSLQNLLKVAVVVLLVVFVASGAPRAATPNPQAQDNPNAIVITQDSNGQTVDVHVGDQVVVKLVAQPTAGYEWRLKTVKSKVIQPPAKPKFRPQSSLVGAPMDELFYLQVQAAGKVTLQFENARTWEVDKPPADTFEVTLRAQ